MKEEDEKDEENDIDPTIMDGDKRRDEIKKFLLENEISQTENKYNSSDDLSSIDREDESKTITDLCILLQEFSRRSMNWPVINIGKFVHNQKTNEYEYKSHDGMTKSYNPQYRFNRRRRRYNAIIKPTIPIEVIDYLIINEGKMILAGGSITDMINGNKVNDYDLFCIGERPNVKSDEMLETMNSYSTIEQPKIQIIKRIYSSPEQVIGGFDLEPSKFFMDHNLEVFCTIGALLSYLRSMNPVNFNSYSSSFVKRINKYIKKGFVPVYVNQKKKRICCNKNKPLELRDLDVSYHSDYGLTLTANKYFNFQEKIFKLNFSALIRDEKDGYCIANGIVIPKEKFIERAKELYKSESISYALEYHFSTSGQLFPKIEGIGTFHDLKKKGGLYIENEKITLFLHHLRIENIEKNYGEYTSIVDKFRISNPGTQHTSSFHPVQFKTLEEHRNFKKKFFGRNYVNRDHSEPDILCFLMMAKRMKIPRPISYLIGCFLCSFKLLDFVSRNNKRKLSQNTKDSESEEEELKVEEEKEVEKKDENQVKTEIDKEDGDSMDVDNPPKDPLEVQKTIPVCKYGPGCYRKNKQHFEEFDHPWLKDEENKK
eukprot:TRINITY_DN1161_c0_g1_i3.p1 TRINITY_DN1161_c0_g1~~TRINITY_DN1161_c0_g1_i3.p1  ORF type:complete len:625 (+),score=199.12 TRINITY_DN1161_c0_g1_i3:82-1875(+)